jgi:hypothetical protein
MVVQEIVAAAVLNRISLIRPSATFSHPMGEGIFFAVFVLLSMNILFFCANFFAAACSDVAQIGNLLYRRIAFGWAPGAARSSDPVAASGLPIRDTAEYNSALLRLRLGRAKFYCG